MTQFCVCVPARNEVERIPILIRALGEQSIGGPVRVALCVNNSNDRTAEAARAAAKHGGGKVSVTLIEKTFPPALAHAGSARRAAMELGAALLDGDGLLISTDADCRPPRDWIAANLASAGPDMMIGGLIELDEDEALAPEIWALRRRFDRYWADVRAIEDGIDPRPWDPAPRHGDHTGASLALPVSLYRRAGGVPLVETGEDRALVEAGIVAGGRLIHPPSVWTRVSARSDGRAAGGMAADVRRWIEAASTDEPFMVPALPHWRARAQWRRVQRALVGEAGLTPIEAQLMPMPHDMALPEL